MEMRHQQIERFRFWNGVIDQVDKRRGIAQAHKQIVQYARNIELPFVMIAEDDIVFTAPGAFSYYCQHRPEEYDLCLGAISYGKIDRFNCVSDFSGLLLYTIHNRFYDQFLSLPETGHIDRGCRNIGLYKVCPAFVVIERDGYSDKTEREEENAAYYAERLLFGRPSISSE